MEPMEPFPLEAECHYQANVAEKVQWIRETLLKLLHPGGAEIGTAVEATVRQAFAQGMLFVIEREKLT